MTKKKESQDISIMKIGIDKLIERRLKLKRGVLFLNFRGVKHE